MHITLRPNERIYINGAVLRADRKVSLELMNDAVFLLEAHVMLERDATTPLRKLYFLVQLMLIEPADIEPKKIMFNLQGLAVISHYKDHSIQAGVSAVTELVNRGRAFEALKVIRSMLPIEDQMMAAARPAMAVEVAPSRATPSGSAPSIPGPSTSGAAAAMSAPSGSRERLARLPAAPARSRKAVAPPVPAGP